MLYSIYAVSEDVNGHQTSEKEGGVCTIKQSVLLLIPEPDRAPDDSEIGSGSEKKPDNDGVVQVLHHLNDQKNETG